MFRVRWLIQPRILLFSASRVVTLDDVRTAILEAVDHLDQVNGGTVHLFVDLRAMEHFPTAPKALRAAKKLLLNHPHHGYTVFLGGAKHEPLRQLIEAVTPVPHFITDNFNHAVYYLLAQDPTLDRFTLRSALQLVAYEIILRPLVAKPQGPT